MELKRKGLPVKKETSSSWKWMESNPLFQCRWQTPKWFDKEAFSFANKFLTLFTRRNLRPGCFRAKGQEWVLKAWKYEDEGTGMMFENWILVVLRYDRFKWIMEF